MQSTSERRMSILEYLCEKRFETIENLAFEFEVSRSTIKRDIEILSISYPLYTKSGIGGGVSVLDDFRLGKKYLSDEQSELLERLLKELNGTDVKVMQSIITQFKKGTN